MRFRPALAAGALEDESADIVVSLYVFEHVPRPGFTLGEIRRILRPGGALLAGSPSAPAWVEPIVERRFAREMKDGMRRRGVHIHSLSPRRWRRLMAAAGMQVEFLTGSHLMRLSGNPLENSQLWIRFNQLWGALFPSLGSEVYLQARK
ncbi:MAG: methyltransferase domain-containing protein [candidate division NC10 bacterium]